MPTLSIITVVYNAKTDLHKTLEELKQQQFTDFELIIIDGGSTDGTLDIIKTITILFHILFLNLITEFTMQ